MTLYIYKGMTSTGTLIEGELSASNTKALDYTLEQQGIRLIRCYPKFFQLILSFHSKPPHEELLEFFLHMSHLMQSGIGLIEALDSYPVSSKSRGMMKKISFQIQQGSLLSECMRGYPSYFNKLSCSLIQIAEKNGDIVSAFEKIRTHLIWKHKITSQFISAIRYPLLLLSLTFCAFLFLMGTVTPPLESFLQELQIDLPVSTKILLGLIPFFKTYGLGFFFLSFGGGWVFYRCFRLQAHKIFYNLPLFGPLFKNFYLAQFAEHLSLMMAAEIPLMDALQISASQMRNKFFNQLLTKIISQIHKGDSLSSALQATSFFPTFFLHVVRAGEASDTLLESFKNIHTYYSEKIDYSLTRMSELIHPLCLLFIGAFLIWMVLGIFYPLYDSLGVVSQ